MNPPVSSKSKVVNKKLDPSMRAKTLSRFQGQKSLQDLKTIREESEVEKLKNELEGLNIKYKDYDDIVLLNTKLRLENDRLTSELTAIKNQLSCQVDMTTLPVKEIPECDSGHHSEDDDLIIKPNFHSTLIVEKPEPVILNNNDKELDMVTLLRLCKSENWTKRQKGLEGLECYLHQSDSLFYADVGQLFCHIIVDPHTKIPSFLVKCFSLFLDEYGMYVDADLLTVLLKRILSKLAHPEITRAFQSKLMLDILKDKFPLSLQVPVLLQYFYHNGRTLSTPNSGKDSKPISLSLLFVICHLNLLTVQRGDDFINTVELLELKPVIDIIMDLSDEDKQTQFPDLSRACQIFVVNLSKIDHPIISKIFRFQEVNNCDSVLPSSSADTHISSSILPKGKGVEKSCSFSAKFLMMTLVCMIAFSNIPNGYRIMRALYHFVAENTKEKLL